MRRERLRPADLIEGIRPVIAATAEARDATLTTDVAALLPFIAVDRVQLQEALTTLLKLPIANVESGTALTLTVNTTGIDASESNRAPFVEITLRGGHEPRRTIHSALASRVVAAHGGRVAKEPGLLRIVLPTEHGPH